MHAVLFAVGDCFGMHSAIQEAVVLRRYFQRTLPKLLTDSRGNGLHWRIARAGAYMVMVTAKAEPRESYTQMLSLQNHPDPATKNLATWALAHRFRVTKDRGSDKIDVMPLHHDTD